MMEALDKMSRAADWLQPSVHMDGDRYHTTGPVTTKRAHEAITAALEYVARIAKIDPTWCDCNEPERGYGVETHRHLPSCRYGIVELWLDQ